MQINKEEEKILFHGGRIDENVNIDAQKFCALGDMYYKGQNRKQDIKQAIKCYEKALESDDSILPVYKLGNVYAKGCQTIKKNTASANIFYQWLLIDTEIHRNNITSGGNLMPPSAVKILIEAAENLADILMSPSNLKLNNQEINYVNRLLDYDFYADYKEYDKYNKQQRYQEAIRILKLVGRMSGKNALFKLGHLYEVGDQITPNLEEAYQFYLRAAKAGHLQAQEKATRLKQIIEKEKSKKAVPEEEEELVIKKRPKKVVKIIEEEKTKTHSNQISAKEETKLHQKTASQISQLKSTAPSISPITVSPAKSQRKKSKKRKNLSSSTSLVTNPNIKKDEKKSDNSNSTKKPSKKQKKSLFNSSSLTEKTSSPPSLKEKKSSDHKPLTPPHNNLPSFTPRFNTTEVGETRQITVIDKKFVPAIEPGKLNYASVRFFKPEIKQKPKSETVPNKKPFNLKDTVPKPAKKQKKLTEEAKHQIGRWGEDCVYHKLKQHYEKKYQGKAKETENGFILEGTDVNQNKVTIEVTWYNKKCESGC